MSNIQGREIVASMAVFVDAQPRRAHYRTFAVRGLEGQDDFAAMAQVVSRRFARLRDAASPDRFDESFSKIPNLVVIDGGKGQLAAALEAIHATYDLPRVAVVALAKREEEVFVPGRAAPDPASAARRGLATSPACSGRGASLRDRLPPPAPRHAGVRVDLRRPRGHRTGAPPRDPQPLRLGRGVRPGVARGARGRSGAARRRRPAPSTRSCTRRGAA